MKEGIAIVKSASSKGSSNSKLILTTERDIYQLLK